MTRFAFGIIMLCMCASCSVYRYDVLSSDISGKEDEPFTLENDTLRVRYSFHDGQGNIEIFNKLTTPLYVDWSRSSLIVDSTSRAYFIDETRVNLISYEPFITGVITNNNPAITFIPPNSRIKKTPFNLSGRVPPVAAYDKKGTLHQYTLESSPLKFRSFLLLSSEQDFSSTIALDHTFWLSEVRQSAMPIPVKPNQNTYSYEALTKGGGAALGAIFFIMILPVAALYAAVD